MTPTPTEPPALDIDRRLGHTTLHPRLRNERRIAWNLMAHLASYGWVETSVYDGEEHSNWSTDPKEAMELLFNLDEASLRFYSPDHCTEHGVLLIFDNGNEGRDVISDWNYSEGDADRFNAIMDQFYPEKVLAELEHEELKAKHSAVSNALQVMVLTPHILAYLREHDPKALVQAKTALGQAAT